jgi:hypothetical protein
MSLPPAGSPFSRLPGIEYRGDTVTFPARDYPEAYARIRFLVGFAAQRKDQTVLRIIGSHPEGMKLIQSANDSIFRLWGPFEAGTWRPGMPAPAARAPR